jgi:bacillithiol system protein YtxJ
MAVLSRSTLPERLFALGDPATVDQFLDGVEWCVVFKAGTSEKTFDAWFLVQKAFEPRVDVAVGLIQVPAGRPASDRVAARTGIAHKSPQFILFRRGQAVAHLDDQAIQPEPLNALMREYLPAAVGPRVVNDRVVTLDGFRALLTAFVDGELPDERFQWAYVERLQKEAAWRDDDSFALLNALFENPWQRDVRPARLVAQEFQAQLAGRLEPLRARAERLLRRMDGARDSRG